MTKRFGGSLNAPYVKKEKPVVVVKPVVVAPTPAPAPAKVEEKK